MYGNALPTKPLDNINDPNGEIALCTLSAFNLGALNNLDELEELADLTVRALDRPAGLSRLSGCSRTHRNHEPPHTRHRRNQLRLLSGKNGVRYSDDSASA